MATSYIWKPKRRLTPDCALALVINLRLFARTPSLGGMESLVEYRAGIEELADRLADLEQALAAV